MKQISLLIITILLATTTKAQSNWKSIDSVKVNGKQDKMILYTDMAWESDSVAYGVNVRGFVERFSLNTNTCKRVDTVNGVNLFKIAVIKGTIWVSSKNALHRLRNGNVKTFDTTNGYSGDNIEAMSFDSKGNIWLATVGGAAKFDGTTFIQYSNIKGSSIAIDANDYVYVSSDSATANGKADDIKVFDGKNWISSVDFFPSNMKNAPISVLDNKNGEVYAKCNNGWIAKLENGKIAKQMLVSAYGLNSLNSILSFDGSTIISASDFNIANSRRFVLVSTNSGQSFSGILDSNLYFKTQSGVKTHNQINNILLKNNKAIFGKSVGALIADLQLKDESSVFDYFDINGIKAGINSNGMLFNTPNRTYINSQFEVPKGEGTTAIFSANIYLGAKDAGGQLHVAAERYNGTDFFAGTINTNFTQYRPNLYKINRSQIDFHKLNYSKSTYKMPTVIGCWPANGDSTLGESKDLAPFIDVNSNGFYDPENGDYPFIKGDQAVYFIYNDAAEKHTASGGEPLGFEIHGMAYGWNKPSDSVLHHTLFFDYTLINRSKHTYPEIKVGHFNDYDLGCGQDDYVGCDTTLNVNLVFNGDNNDQNCNGNLGYGLNPPLVGMQYLSHKMGNFLYHNNGSGNTGDPYTALGYYNYMNSKWLDGSQMVYGGNGHKSTGGTIPTNYMFSGTLSSNGWTEVSVGNPSGDRRGLSTITLPEMKPGDRKSYSFAYLYTRITNTEAAKYGYNYSFDKFKNAATQNKAFYDTIQHQGSPVLATKWAPIPPSHLSKDPVSVADFVVDNQNEILLYPNPNKGSFTLHSSNAIKEIKVINLQSKVVFEKSNLNSQQMQIELPSSLAKGMYLVNWQNVNNEVGVLRIVVE